ncbi:hypothetical protein BTO20_24230 [Mycobacterium dioxanotrophicus]|uniref:Uncharacterized protein n=1 Tax=Mycobacterium dioxanotrophicus TaxID=482462 RepID=A0A1Y0C7M2_9MYCO|nr:hypothetical protein [Mycobacterium dioxanotrophicus]ART71238.1 hypothetical protein BTO20_24230 [Mycobacterium dioxanotrophicus]
MCCGDDEIVGPTVDVEFFTEVWKAFDKYPDARQKYSISTLPLQAKRLGVNLQTDEAVTRYDGDRIITEFEPRQARRAHHMCCEWSEPHHWGSCVRWCQE